MLERMTAVSSDSAARRVLTAADHSCPFIESDEQRAAVDERGDDVGRDHRLADVPRLLAVFGLPLRRRHDALHFVGQIDARLRAGAQFTRGRRYALGAEEVEVAYVFLERPESPVVDLLDAVPEPLSQKRGSILVFACACLSVTSAATACAFAF